MINCHLLSVFSILKQFVEWNLLFVHFDLGEVTVVFVLFLFYVNFELPGFS